MPTNESLTPAGTGTRRDTTTTQVEFDPLRRQLSNRRAAARRVPQLDGGYSDPFSHLAHVERDSPNALQGRAVEAWRQAAAHLFGCGLVPVVPAAAARALQLDGDTSRRLAELLHISGGVSRK